MRTGVLLAGMALFLGCVVYVCWHLWRLTPGAWPVKLTVTGLFILWMASEFAGFAILERLPLQVASVWYEVASIWLIAFFYLLLLFFLADVASLCHLLPKDCLKDSAVSFAGIIGTVAVILSLGGLHYHHKYREEMTLFTDKPLEKPLTIVLASDLHIGYHNCKAELGRWVDLINAEKPDLVLLCGDVIDHSLRPVKEGNCAEEFRRIEAPVCTVLGNHESFGDINGIDQYFKAAGITLLKDSVVHFKGVDVLGRYDRSFLSRASLRELSDGLSGFTILLDHQPYDLKEAELAGIDFQFSGHTHYGQVWPMSWLTALLFEKAWGHHARGNTKYYISSGLGIWGPKIRIGSRSEYLVLHLKPITADHLS